MPKNIIRNSNEKETYFCKNVEKSSIPNPIVEYNGGIAAYEDPADYLPKCITQLKAVRIA